MIGSPRGGTSFHELGTPERPASERPTTVVRMVAPGYFHTLRIPVLRGREFTDADNANPMAGFVVNETFARTYFSGRDPFASSISVWMMADNPYLPIIGVVGDVSEGSVRSTPKPTVFYSHGRMTWSTMTLFVRARQPESFVRPVTAALHELDPTLVVSNVRTIESALAESLARERISALISTSFGVGGLLLAALGLYGLLAYLVAERTKDIGIRIALGARLARITGSVVAGGLALVAIGTAIGVAGSLLLLRSLGTLLFGVTPYDVPDVRHRRRAAGRHRRARVLPARAPRSAHRAADGAPTGVGPRGRGGGELSRRPKHNRGWPRNVLIKEKHIPIATLTTSSQGDVVEQVRKRLPSLPFVMDVHTRAWRYYKVRPPRGDANPDRTRPEYCIYDQTHEDYV
jgi:hypothetical protein